MIDKFEKWIEDRPLMGVLAASLFGLILGIIVIAIDWCSQ